MRLNDFIEKTTSALGNLYPGREARNIVYILVCERLGVENWQIPLKYDEVVDEKMLSSDVHRLILGEPLQYVLGYSDFYGRRFKVNSNVLIPRPETELLVEWALGRDLPINSKVLDLCTGSGAIAWTLAAEKQQWSVTGVDISEGALSVAESQMIQCANPPKFVRGDVLDKSFLRTLGSYDMLVSNPPYIMESEKSDMRRNVTDFEPGLALFVPDSDALVFYKSIAKSSAILLKKGGVGIVECNERLSYETASAFETAGLVDVRVMKDLTGKDRFVTFSNLKY